MVNTELFNDPSCFVKKPCEQLRGKDGAKNGRAIYNFLSFGNMLYNSNVLCKGTENVKVKVKNARYALISIGICADM